MAGWDYGKTPNVWRPAEVQVPGSGADLGLGAQPVFGEVYTETITEYGYPPLGGSPDAFGWIVRESHPLTHTVSIPNATTSVIVGDSQPPTAFSWKANHPLIRLILRGEIDSPGSSITSDVNYENAEGAGTFINNGGLTAATSNNTEIKWVYIYYLFVTRTLIVRLAGQLYVKKEIAPTVNTGNEQGTAVFGVGVGGYITINTDEDVILGNYLDSAFSRKIRFVMRNNSSIGAVTCRPTSLEVHTPPDGFAV